MVRLNECSNCTCQAVWEAASAGERRTATPEQPRRSLPALANRLWQRPALPTHAAVQCQAPGPPHASPTATVCSTAWAAFELTWPSRRMRPVTAPPAAAADCPLQLVCIKCTLNLLDSAAPEHRALCQHEHQCNHAAGEPAAGRHHSAAGNRQSRRALQHSTAGSTAHSMHLRDERTCSNLCARRYIMCTIGRAQRSCSTPATAGASPSWCT